MFLLPATATASLPSLTERKKLQLVRWIFAESQGVYDTGFAASTQAGHGTMATVQNPGHDHDQPTAGASE